MAEKIKIGVVGCGGIFNGAHIWAYDRPENENSKAKVVALCDIKIEKAYATAEKLGVDKSHCYEDFKEMIEKEKLDAVDICTPNYLHSIVAVHALNNGLHVFS